MPISSDLESLKASLPDDWKDVPVLSYSQIMKADRCSFLWYIDYFLKLESKKNSEARDIGTFGHLFLKDLYRSLADGMTISAWVEKRLPAVVMQINEDEVLFPDQLNYLATAMQIMHRYCQDEIRVLGDHTPVGAEQHFFVLVTLDDGRRFVLQGYVDLITIDSKNRIWVWDHKFSSKMWSPLRIKMYIQLSIYRIILRADGIHVYGEIVNQLNSYDYKGDGRDKKSDDDLFKREYNSRGEGELANIWREFLAMAAHVLDLREGKVVARRSIRDADCIKCDRLIPCHANLAGDPLTDSIDRHNKSQIAIRSQIVGSGVSLDLD